MENELLDIVDKNDNIIWIKERHEVYKKKLINRVCHVIVVNTLWKIALQKRSMTVSFMPGAWSSSAWGHVSSWDDYELSAKRELKEEIWIYWDLTFIDKILYKNSKNNHFKFVWIFELEYEWKFSYEDGEVEFVEWFSLEEIKNMINRWEIFHPELIYILENYYY